MRMMLRCCSRLRCFTLVSCGSRTFFTATVSPAYLPTKIAPCSRAFRTLNESKQKTTINLTATSQPLQVGNLFKRYLPSVRLPLRTRLLIRRRRSLLSHLLRNDFRPRRIDSRFAQVLPHGTKTAKHSRNETQWTGDCCALAAQWSAAATGRWCDVF